jgi:hypothetical protein
MRSSVRTSCDARLFAVPLDHEGDALIVYARTTGPREPYGGATRVCASSATVGRNRAVRMR